MSRPNDLFGERAKAAVELAERRWALRSIDAKIAIRLYGADDESNALATAWSKRNPEPSTCRYSLETFLLPNLCEPAARWPTIDFGLRIGPTVDSQAESREPEKERNRWSELVQAVRSCSPRGELSPHLAAELNGWTLYEGPDGAIEAAQTESEAWAAIALEVLKDGRPQLLTDLAEKCARVTISSDDEETLKVRARKTLHVWLNRQKNIQKIGRGIYLLKPQVGQRRSKSQSEEEAGAHSSAPEAP